MRFLVLLCLLAAAFPAAGTGGGQAAPQASASAHAGAGAVATGGSASAVGGSPSASAIGGGSTNAEMKALGLPGAASPSANACQATLWIVSYDVPDCFHLQFAEQFRQLGAPLDALYMLCQSKYAAKSPTCAQHYPKPSE